MLLPKVPRVPDGPLPNGYKQLLDEKGPRAVSYTHLAKDVKPCSLELMKQFWDAGRGHVTYMTIA